MTAAAAISLITQIIVNLPAAIATGAQVIALINDAYKSLSDAVGDRDVTREEIDMLVTKIVANSAAIQAME
ncbi:MAG: hypothetical protein HOP13_11055 [Alphaproteobacteria bacterium]|nr:hypothetical protein [Alphaproteobacteria bacterium]